MWWTWLVVPDGLVVSVRACAPWWSCYTHYILALYGCGGYVYHSVDLLHHMQNVSLAVRCSYTPTMSASCQKMTACYKGRGDINCVAARLFTTLVNVILPQLERKMTKKVQDLCWFNVTLLSSVWSEGAICLPPFTHHAFVHQMNVSQHLLTKWTSLKTLLHFSFLARTF